MGDLDTVLRETIRKECQKYFGEIGKEEIKKLIVELLPEIDKVVAKHVKEHFVFLANKMKENFDTNQAG